MVGDWTPAASATARVVSASRPLSADEQLTEQAHLFAKAQCKSLHAMFREWLEQFELAWLVRTLS
jgi:hypothetical protein